MSLRHTKFATIMKIFCRSYSLQLSTKFKVCPLQCDGGGGSQLIKWSSQEQKLRLSGRKKCCFNCITCLISQPILWIMNFLVPIRANPLNFFMRTCAHPIQKHTIGFDFPKHPDTLCKWNMHPGRQPRLQVVWKPGGTLLGSRCDKSLEVIFR